MIQGFAYFRRMIVLALLAAVAACASKEEPKVDENAYPADYRKAILAFVQSSRSYDPTNIREASIGEPTLKPVVNTTRYLACVRFNPRDFDRRYMGLSEYVVYFYAGEITQFVKATGDVCAGTAYQPFPELEKICFAAKCD